MYKTIEMPVSEIMIKIDKTLERLKMFLFYTMSAILLIPFGVIGFLYYNM
jgi:hypothetical protein